MVPGKYGLRNIRGPLFRMMFYKAEVYAMKTIILNGSPRKNWNTAQMLKEAQRGSESVGAETEYIDLFDLSYTGCRSCLACKRKGSERCKCFWKDDLSPVIDRIFAADALIIGSPLSPGSSRPSAPF